MENMPKNYDAEAVEQRMLDKWLAGDYYRRNPGVGDCTVTIPPPNVTGKLHMGHALDDTIQDTIIRMNRMRGVSTRWILGTDHAGIATQTKVDKKLASEGISRREIGREKFVDACWDWTHEYGGHIVEQIKRMGCSVDFDNERFTMDEDYAQAVRKVFCDWYHDGLIYRGKRIVNWCPNCTTAISDDEAEYKDEKGHLWHLRYPLTEPVNGQDYIVVATTRPETMLGDTGVAVSPKDPEKAAFVGKTVKLPIVDREIPIFEDWHVDANFGSGFVKVTPAHDPNDYAMGQAHDLPQINIFDEHAVVVEGYGEFTGMNRDECREAVIKWFEEHDLLDHVEDHDHSVMHCYRCDAALEPWLSEQWFVAVDKLKGPATEAVTSGKVTFHPSRWTQTYLTWMENLKDWCISRQLWWGQRIPAYYLPKGGFVVALTAEEALEKARAKSGDASLQLADLRQDEDVLDTWFSSWLWPISVFDGIRFPDNREIGYYYPTNDLVTGPDIIFFWVARMIMAGYEYRGEKPFSNVYFTGIVRDKIGRKMSKQLGNSPDPLDLIAQYGADGVRMAMLISSSAGNDVMFDEALCEQGRNFGNKIWNAYRLLNGWAVDAAAAQSENNRLAVAWFGQALDRSLRQIAEDFKSYRISEAFKEAYRLFWDDFSGLYLEMAKPAYGQPIDAPTMEATKGYFDALMRVLHPFMPFVTEEIWQDLAPRAEGASICVAQMPEPAAEDAAMLARFELAKEIITSVRNIRNQKSLPQKEALTLRVIADENYPAEFAPVVMKMANLTAIETVAEKDPAAAAFIVKTTQYFVPMAGKIDAEAERKKLADDLAYYEGFLASVMKKLSNERFVASAPEKVVANERAKQADAEAKITAIREQLAALESGK